MIFTFYGHNHFCTPRFFCTPDHWESKISKFWKRPVRLSHKIFVHLVFLTNVTIESLRKKNENRKKILSNTIFVHSFFFHFRRLRVTKLFAEKVLSKASHKHFCTPRFFFISYCEASYFFLLFFILTIMVSFFTTLKNTPTLQS